MHVRVAQVAGKDLKEREQKNKGMTSAQMREKKVVEARRIQEERYRGMPHRENGWLEESGNQAETVCRIRAGRSF